MIDYDTITSVLVIQVVSNDLLSTKRKQGLLIYQPIGHLKEFLMINQYPIFKTNDFEEDEKNWVTYYIDTHSSPFYLFIGMMFIRTCS